ncbi:MAG: endonuclease III [Proteobacteria bacterium]|nr:endonuclease III [Pseudomonadota bacterium]
MCPESFPKICAVLDAFYPDPPIPLAFTDAYTLLVAVVLSAQCTDKRVNEVTPELWKHGTTPAAIAALGADKIAEIIKPCGLYSRKSQNIYELSKTIAEVYHGIVPSEREKLEALPGVGRKTANVILSHVFNIPAFAVDTHVMRLAQRWQWSEAKTPEGVERDLCSLFPENEWTKRHLQMIYFGRNICKAKGHDDTQCPACSLLSQNRQEKR